jgi:hypothetical protein
MSEFKPIDIKKYLQTPIKVLDKTDKTGFVSFVKPNLPVIEPKKEDDAALTLESELAAPAEIRIGTAPDTLPRLPWQLERLVSAASSNALELELRGVHDLNRYTMAWAAAYLTGDRDEALARLWAVHRAWQGVN